MDPNFPFDYLSALVQLCAPDGMTPLMLASIRGGGVDLGVNEDDPNAEEGEGSDSMIAKLILHGASLSAKTEKTGRWKDPKLNLVELCKDLL